ncbi:MAG: septal ring lytic transglycosylase RlpA family protein [Rickettsiaceae bacterium]|nr:septal ring lytic transglycosylase RlpA family protein [Rickettsiaceae bacterium]
MRIDIIRSFEKEVMYYIKNSIIKLVLIISLLQMLTSCKSMYGIISDITKKRDSYDKYQGHYKTNRKDPILKSYTEIGIASWYGVKRGKKKAFHGNRTANGDVFDTEGFTGAHRTLPLPSIVKVTNLKNGKSAVIMINDRGPYKKTRILDVSSKVAKVLDFKEKGLAKTKIEYLHKETEELLDKLSLKSEHGSKPYGKIKNPRCSIKCFLKKLNQ